MGWITLHCLQQGPHFHRGHYPDNNGALKKHSHMMYWQYSLWCLLRQWLFCTCKQMLTSAGVLWYNCKKLGDPRSVVMLSQCRPVLSSCHSFEEIWGCEFQNQCHTTIIATNRGLKNDGCCSDEAIGKKNTLCTYVFEHTYPIFECAIVYLSNTGAGACILCVWPHMKI